MTKRDLFEAIVNGAEITEEMKELAAHEIQKLDEANEKRKEKLAAKKAENEPLKQKIYDDILKELPTTATVVGEYLEISPQKATVLLKQLVAEGKATQTDVKVKNRSAKGYIRA
jgi:CRP-like cAMP-binding protein